MAEYGLGSRGFKGYPGDGRVIDAINSHHPSLIVPQWIKYTPIVLFGATTTTYNAVGRYMPINEKVILLEVEVQFTASSLDSAIPITVISLPINAASAAIFPASLPPTVFSGTYIGNALFSLVSALQPAPISGPQFFQYSFYNGGTTENLGVPYRVIFSGHYGII